MLARFTLLLSFALVLAACGGAPAPTSTAPVSATPPPVTAPVTTPDPTPTPTPDPTDPTPDPSDQIPPEIVDVTFTATSSGIRVTGTARDDRRLASLEYRVSTLGEPDTTGTLVVDAQDRWVLELPGSRAARTLTLTATDWNGGVSERTFMLDPAS